MNQKPLQPKHIFLGNLMETLDLITNHKWRITKSFRPWKPPTIGGFGPVADVIGEPMGTHLYHCVAPKVLRLHADQSDQKGSKSAIGKSQPAFKAVQGQLVVEHRGTRFPVGNRLGTKILQPSPQRPHNFCLNF